jgi:hypothetical protein
MHCQNDCRKSASGVIGEITAPLDNFSQSNTIF